MFYLLLSVAVRSYFSKSRGAYCYVLADSLSRLKTSLEANYGLRPSVCLSGPPELTQVQNYERYVSPPLLSVAIGGPEAPKNIKLALDVLVNSRSCSKTESGLAHGLRPSLCTSDVPNDTK